MFSISVAIGPTNLVWVLLFKSKEAADKARSELGAAAGVIATSDDYGQQLSARADAVNAILFENLDETRAAYIERALHQARTNAKTQQLAQADPALRMAQAGPSVLSPMGNGRY